MTSAIVDRPPLDFAEGVTTLSHDLTECREASAAVEKRLQALSELKAGWDGANGRAVHSASLVHASRIAQQALRAGLAGPELFPVPDGGVQFEWSVGPVGLELEIEPCSRAMVFACDRPSGMRIHGERARDGSLVALVLALLNAHRRAQPPHAAAHTRRRAHGTAIDAE